jgi:hypothetical protein
VPSVAVVLGYLDINCINQGALFTALSSVDKASPPTIDPAPSSIDTPTAYPKLIAESSSKFQAFSMPHPASVFLIVFANATLSYDSTVAVFYGC